MKAPLVVILLPAILLLKSCIPCDPVTIENGPIADSVLALVPYQEGNAYALRHSNGLIVHFETFRETTDDYTYCAECCSPVYHYEVNSTRLIPDYPVFECRFEISNRDTLMPECYASIGKYGFFIPTSAYQLDYFEKIDSITINGDVYEDVFKLTSDYGAVFDNDSIYADSLFYNYMYGILKISMSNGEYYEIVR